MNPLDQGGFQEALAGLTVAQPGQRYTDEQLRLSVLFLHAYGVLRMSHINDQPVESWGVVLGTSRRPDGDTLDQYLNAIIARDETAVEDELLPATLPGQVRPGGLIDTAQLNSLVTWAQAGLFTDEAWLFDGHVIEYTGQADIGKTKHGTKQTSVKAIKRFTLFNRINTYTEYFPAHVSFDEAMRQMVVKANAVLPPEYRIRKLAFDKEGWDADLLQWLADEQAVIPITWVKATATNERLLAAVPLDAFVPLEDEITVGKSEETHRIVQVADTQIPFPELGPQRVVVLETDAGTRLGIYTTALHPKDAALDDERVVTTTGLMDALRFKQRIENGFKVETHEMDSDAIPTHRVHDVRHTEPYDLAQAQRQLAKAEKRLDKYDAQDRQHQRLLDTGQIDKHEFNTLAGRTQRLRQQTLRELEKLNAELDSVEVDEQGQAVRSYTTQVLDVRKLTLLNLFKTHALATLHFLAQQLGLPGVGPARLRREFLAFGDRVEFDPERRVATVYAQPLPRARMQQAYERLCALLNDLPVTLERDGVSYRVRFSW